MLLSVLSSDTERKPGEKVALMAILKSPSEDPPPSLVVRDSPLDRLEAALQTFLNSSPDFLIVFSNVI
jgi:hypothetical protein